jgi:creatinine amidohydrolase
MAFPGSVTIKTETLLAFVRDILDSLRRAGFRRVLIVNGHGGNNPVQAMSQDWMGAHPEMSVRLHNWWNAPKTWAKVVEIDPIGSHASWMENFPWTRLANVALPREQKKVIDHDRMRTMGPSQVREYIGDGNYGGLYQRADDEMQMIWNVAVDETRALMRDGWR